MDLNDPRSRSQPESEINPLESRVSGLSISDSINSSFHSDCHGLKEEREGDELKPLSGIMSQPMDGHGGCENELCLQVQYLRKEDDVRRVPTSQSSESLDLGGEDFRFEDEQMCKPEKCTTLPDVHLRVNDNGNSEFVSSIMAESKTCDASTCTADDENICFMNEKLARSEKYDGKLPHVSDIENDERRSCISQVIHQVASNEEFVNEASQHMRNIDDAKIGFVGQEMAKTEECDISIPQLSDNNNDKDVGLDTCHSKRGKYFFYDSPLSEETGVWIPVSVPPMSESENEEWAIGIYSNGGTFPEEDMGWGDLFVGDKELTMWDVVVEMLLAARGKVNAFASGDIPNISWMSSHIIEQAWKEMAQTLTEVNYDRTQEILETEPPRWLPDSAASACMLCSVRFHPIMYTRHHCRFCGGIFCSDCTKGRSLLPEKFRTADPQRVCDVCCVRLESVQSYLMDQVSRAAQLPTHDLTDLSTLRSWLNFPWGQSMEYEIYKATNTIRGYNQVGSLRLERSIPDAILREAKGLAILTVMKVGVMVTYNIGTGLVIARREDGSWSPPSAISSFGVGWGAQVGGEFTDFIIVLRSSDAVKTFSGEGHLSVGAGVSAAVGIVGRTAEADIRAGTGGYSACYTYSCSKGAFVGCSLEGSIVTTRAKENSRFYGSQSITAPDILIGSLPRPPAAATLYRALADMYQKA